MVALFLVTPFRMISASVSASTNFGHHGERSTKPRGVFTVLPTTFDFVQIGVSTHGGHATLTQLKQAAFATPAGHAGNFEETEDGGFVVFVQSRKPVDLSKMNAELPQFTATLRRQRQNEAFNQWLSIEANRELRDTPFAKEIAPK